MKKNIFLTVIAALAVLFTTSCSDVKYDNTPYSDPVSNITFSVSKGDLTIKWTNPAGATGAAIFKDGDQIAAVGQGVDTYVYENAGDNALHYWTIKAIYDGMGVSEGCTDTITVPASNKVGYVLTTDSYTSLPDDDELAAAEWFKTNYVDTDMGLFVKAADIKDLDVEEVTELWIQIDRVGIGLGWRNLPFTSEQIAALKKYVQDGGALFLTKHATQLVAAIGRVDEKYAPGLFGDGDGGVGTDVWCMNCVIGCKTDAAYDHRGHKAFVGLEAGDPNGYGFETYPMEGPGLREDHNCMWDLNSYGFSGQPNVVANWESTTNSTVLTTWGHVSDYCCAGIIEFNPTTEFAGSIIACGLSTYEFKQNAPAEGEQNAYQSNIEKFTKNCLEYLK